MKEKRIDPEWWKYIPFGENTFRKLETEEEVHETTESCNRDCTNCEYDFKCLTENMEKELHLLNAENIKLKAELKQLRRRVINF